MDSYYFSLDLGKQRRDMQGKRFTKVITCNDIYKEGLDLFINEINKDGRFMPIEDDMSYQKI